jgi:hypothetical protein
VAIVLTNFIHNINRRLASQEAVFSCWQPAKPNAPNRPFDAHTQTIASLKQIEVLQNELYQYAWQQPDTISAPDLVAQSVSEIYRSQQPVRKYRPGKKPRKQMAERTCRTRKDPFELVLGRH